VLLKYTPEEARNLKNYGEIPESAKINEDAGDDNDDNIAFDDVSDEEEADDPIDAI